MSDAGKTDLWVYEWARDTMSRLTFSSGPAGSNNRPVWAPDGKHIAFGSDKDSGQANIYWVRSDGSGETVRLTESKNFQAPWSFSPDGKRLAYYEVSPEKGPDIWTLPLDMSDADHPKAGKPELVLATNFTEVYPSFSPDGRWLAYGSNESGRAEVYVRPFPGPGGKWQVSTGGGNYPVWSRQGHELYYESVDRRLWVASYSTKAEAFVADKPKPWSEKQLVLLPRNLSFDLAPGRKQFAILLTPEEPDKKPTTQLTFLLNFFDELRRRAPK